MKVTFLGGADEVGASCTVVEISGRRILVDCGIRMSAPGEGSLPDLKMLNDLGEIEAVILTHAHLDHVGGMPAFYGASRTAPIYMTPATLQISAIMLADALKIMELQQKELGIAPIYPPEAVERVIQAARCVPFGHTVELFEGSVRMQFLPAGHILGAASVILEGEDGTIYMTGDVSVTDQIAIPGMIVPERLRPDLVVIESTYGGRAHAGRASEEARIIEQVAEVIGQGGAVLFPAFAVGRAQEVILILSRAIEEGRLPRGVPIYVDGLVRQICKVYSSQASILTPWLRKRVERVGNPFFYEGAPTLPVWDPGDRNKVTSVRPAIIVASSGMLTGGPSQLYARGLADDPRSLIAITGYQDEESPGRKLQEVAAAGGGTLKLGDGEVTLKCRVGTYGLSAHADTRELVEVLAALKPRKVALVHGDSGARKALEEAIESARAGAVIRPKAGDTIEIEGAAGRTLARRSAAVVDAAVSVEALPEVASALLLRDGANQEYTLQEILWGLGGAEATLDEGMIDAMGAALGQKGSPFKRDKKRPFIYRVRVLDGGGGGLHLSGESRKAQRKKVQVEVTRLLERVAEVFPPETGVYKRKVRRVNHVIVLFFPFPAIARELHRERMEALAEETGWSFVVRDTPHQGALVEAAREALPTSWAIKGSPALHVEAGRVAVKVEGDGVDESALAEVKAAFKARTAFTLDVELVGGPGLSAAPVAEVGGVGSAQRPRLEINKTYEIIREGFEGQAHAPFKVSLKGDHVEVAFISPVIGERYRERLDALEGVTGWPLQVRPQADQHRIKELAKALVPEGWRSIKEPGFRQEDESVTLRIDRPLPPDERRHMEADFWEACGYKLIVKN